MEYIDSFEAYAASTELSHQAELTLATAKLTGDAKMWWRDHHKSTPTGSPERIRTWEQLQRALTKHFAPPEQAEAIRCKLHALKQKGSVEDYTYEFRRLSMQIKMSFDEAKFAYTQGLQPKIRDLVRTKDNIKSIQELQLACHKLDTHNDKQTTRDDGALVADSSSMQPTSKGANKRVVEHATEPEVDSDAAKTLSKAIR